MNKINTMNKPFVFKEFSVNQDRCAMKIGTDGVLLGAWSKINEDISSILDIGTGTGIIGLILAQRSTADTSVVREAQHCPQS